MSSKYCVSCFMKTSCIQRSFKIDGHPHSGPHIADYDYFMTLPGRCGGDEGIWKSLTWRSFS